MTRPNANPFVIDPRDPIDVAYFGAQLGAHVLVEYLVRREAERVAATCSVRRNGSRRTPPKIPTTAIHVGLHDVFERVRRIARGEESP